MFEAAGKRYAAVRALTRDKKGLVHTKEARLAFGVYEKVGQRARERAKLAAEHMRNAHSRWAPHGGVTPGISSYPEHRVCPGPA